MRQPGVNSEKDPGKVSIAVNGSALRGAELIQMAAMAIRSGMTADALAAQLSVHPSQTERFVKIAAHDHHEICEVPERP
mgnify:CR=1 FL=1